MSDGGPVFERGIAATYFLTIRDILVRPRVFFQEMPVSGGLSGPLAFALVTHWIGAALHFLEGLWLEGPFSKLQRNFFQSLFGGADSGSFQFSYQASGDFFGDDNRLLQLKDRIYEWFMGAGPVVADPFLVLFSLVFTSFLVFLGARILVSHPPEKLGSGGVSYESAARICCYSLAPSLLLGVPFLGKLIASTTILIVMVIGAQEVYQVKVGRAVVIALFPKLLVFGFLMSGLVLLSVMLFNLFALFF